MAKPSCDKCGKPHPKCNGHNRAGNPCGQAVSRSGVCYFHGAEAPQVIAADERRQSEAEARAACEDFLGHHWVTEHDDPITGLLDEIARSGAAVAFYAARVRELARTPETAEQAVARHAEAMANDEPVPDAPDALMVMTMFGPVPSVWVKLWTDERVRHAKLCKLGVDAGLAERMAKVNEDVATLLAQAVMDSLSDPEVAMPPAMQSKVREVVGRHLRVLEGGAAA